MLVMILRELFKDHCLLISRSSGSCLHLFIQRLIQILISHPKIDHLAPLAEGTLDWLNQVDVGSELPNCISSACGQRSILETRFQRKWNCFCPEKWQIREITSDHALESTASFWGCSNVLEDLSFSSLKLAHAKSSLLSLWSYVSRHRCKEGYCPSDLKICTCSMLTLCSSMSLQLFFSIYARLLIRKTCLWSAQHGTKESFEKLWHEKNKTHWPVFFFICSFCSFKLM